MSKLSTWLCIVGSILLLIMGLFHLSGLNWISGEIAASDAKPFLKDVFPALFVHVSIQLIGLAALGCSLIFCRSGVRVIAVFIATMVAANTALALWLGAYPPSVLLACAAICFGVVAMGSAENRSL